MERSISTISSSSPIISAKQERAKLIALAIELIGLLQAASTARRWVRRGYIHGVSVRATPEDFKAFADPDWTASRVAALADTALNVESSHELARIDVKGDYAVAVSRLEWARNDTTKTNPNGSYRRVSGGWESLWFLRKIDGNWKFTGAVGGIKSWGGGD